ncbi:MAG TPA: hypothetical protein VKH42_17385 [Vicinamibacterales bacterium]|nr:hypothetical protein [Vicinamibacterales bacterium]
MRIVLYTVGLVTAASVAAANPPAKPVQQPHGNPHTTTTTTTTTTAKPSTPSQKPKNPHSPKSTPTTATSGGTTTTSGGTTKTTSGGTTTTTTDPPKLNPIASKISSNHGLSSKVAGMLTTIIDPKTGKAITLDAASMGFKNQGQFIAALHVSQNQGISFLDLKKAMVTSQTTASGTTMSQTGSLGQAIQTVKGTSDATAVTTAEHQADEDVKTTTTTPTTGSKTKPKPHSGQ